MLIATKKNRQLRIPDNMMEHYAELNYTIKDESGKVVFKPRDVEAELKEAQAEIKKLNDEIDRLKKAAEKQTAKKTKKADAPEESSE